MRSSVGHFPRRSTLCRKPRCTSACIHFAYFLKCPPIEIRGSMARPSALFVRARWGRQWPSLILRCWRRSTLGCHRRATRRFRARCAHPATRAPLRARPRHVCVRAPTYLKGVTCRGGDRCGCGTEGVGGMPRSDLTWACGIARTCAGARTYRRARGRRPPRTPLDAAPTATMSSSSTTRRR